MKMKLDPQQHKLVRNLVIIILMLSVFMNLMIDSIESGKLIIVSCHISLQDESVRMMHLNCDFEHALKKAEEFKVPVGDYITILMVLNDYSITDSELDSISKTDFLRFRNRLIRLKPEEFKKLSSTYTGLLNDLCVYPVPVSNKPDFPWISYVDSWGNERTYGGERRHEGTDLMAGDNEAGIYPVLSVCDGTVSNMGWLELGGYRLGITSNNGIYYYYAHMQSYADIKVGDKVTAGQFLGFMGNTGYSQIEGTSGKFDVHLHFGVYLTDVDGTEISINPFYLLKHTENKKLYYNYGM